MNQELVKASQLKVNYNGNLKRVRFQNNFNDLIKEITLAFNINLSNDLYLTISYLDDENDKISISNDFDLEQAKLFATTYKKECLKVDVELKSAFGEDFIHVDKPEDINAVSIEKIVSKEEIKDKIEDLKVQIDKLRLKANQIKTSVYIPINNQDNCIIANKDTFDVQVKEYTDLRKIVKITNTGKSQWNKYYTLVCLDPINNENYLKGNKIEIKTILKPGETINLEIFIPKDKIVSGKYISIWQMKNHKDEFFGEQIELTIHTIANANINILGNFFDMAEKTDYNNLKYTSQYLKNLKEMKQMYDLGSINDTLLLQMLELTKGNIEEAITLLF